MECLGLIVLLSIIHCQTSNETGFTGFPSAQFEEPFERREEAEPSPRRGPRPLALPPLQLPINPHKFISFNESLNFHSNNPAHGLEPSDIEDPPEPMASPSTTLSRIIETKYGKVQELSLTLFSNHQQKNYNHPLRNKIVEVRDSSLHQLPFTLTFDLPILNRISSPPQNLQVFNVPELNLDVD